MLTNWNLNKNFTAPNIASDIRHQTDITDITDIVFIFVYKLEWPESWQGLGPDYRTINRTGESEPKLSLLNTFSPYSRYELHLTMDKVILGNILPIRGTVILNCRPCYSSTYSIGLVPLRPGSHLLNYEKFSTQTKQVKTSD